MKDPRITEEVKEQIEEKIISSFLSTEFMQTYFVEHENVDVDFETQPASTITTQVMSPAEAIMQGMPIDQIVVTLSPVNTDVLKTAYAAYVNNSNAWAQKNGLFVSNIYAGETVPNEITFVFDIVDLDKLLDQEQALTLINASDLLTGIKDRANKIQKHSMSTQMSISTNDAQELHRIYERLRVIEENCDNRVIALQEQLGIKAPKKEQKFWVTLNDRNGKEKDRMEVSYKEEDYAKSAFQASGNTVHPTDTIKFE